MRSLDLQTISPAEANTAAARPELDSVRQAIDVGRAGSGLRARSEPYWRWRLANPDGVCAGFARQADRVQAAVVGVRHRARLDGEDVDWVEVVDTFNDFDAGRGLARTGAYSALCAEFARAFGGRAPEGANVFYGVPTRRAHRFELARLRSEILRSENALVIAPSSVTWVAPGVEVEEVDAFPDEIGGAFERFAEGRGAVQVRDAARLNWRFTAHPDRAYRIALARVGGELVGYAVYRRGSYAGHEGGVLADWMVRPEERDVMQGLLLWAGDAARSDGHDLLVTNVANRAGEFGAFQGVGFRVHGTDEYLTFRSFQKPYIMSWLFAHWYYTLGDSERG